MEICHKLLLHEKIYLEMDIVSVNPQFQEKVI